MNDFPFSPHFYSCPTNIGNLSCGIAEVIRGKIVALVSIMSDPYLGILLFTGGGHTVTS